MVGVVSGEGGWGQLSGFLHFFQTKLSFQVVCFCFFEGRITNRILVWCLWRLLRASRDEGEFNIFIRVLLKIVIFCVIWFYYYYYYYYYYSSDSGTT